MTATNLSEMEQRCTELRRELKLWEKQFAVEHDGRKAGRDDIKADATISGKYKEYNKVRDLLSGKTAEPTSAKSPRKRRHSNDAQPAPEARNSTSFATPMKKAKFTEPHKVDTPSSTAEFLSPQGPSMIGPTPQRDGIVLGLFDLLPEATPGKSGRRVLGDVMPNILQTPSRRRRGSDEDGSTETPARGERTPQSSGKRFLLDKFVTPKKRKLVDDSTPTSELKHLRTPAFLRRDNVLDVIDEEDEVSSRPAPWKRRAMGRTLSSMIKAMKEQKEEERRKEEAEQEEDLAILREIEMEAEGLTAPKKPPPKAPEVVVEDSQVEMPLGPDGAVDSDEERATERERSSGKVWKKRGQKRQTKRIIMRPTFLRSKPQPETKESDGEDGEAEVVAETQLQPVDAGSDFDFREDPDTSDYSNSSHSPKKRKTDTKGTEKAAAGQDKKKEASEGVVKAAVRKVKQSAHENYRRLKIRSKTGNGGKGRFGRRR